MSALDLAGRVVVVTGVSRRDGIAFAMTRRLLIMGADVFLTHHRAHDEGQPWGADDLDAVLGTLREYAPPAGSSTSARTWSIRLRPRGSSRRPLQRTAISTSSPVSTPNPVVTVPWPR